MWWLVLSLWFILSLSSTTKSEGGRNVGDRCINYKCGGMNLICKNETRTCECRSEFPIEVRSGMNPPSTLCLKPAKLEEECYHDRSCIESDDNSKCQQVGNQARCECVRDFHKMMDNSQRMLRCVPDTQLTNSDLATFIGVGVGMTLFCGLTCLVLRIFARARFGPHRHHYANAHLSPPTVITEHAEGGSNNSHYSSQRSSIGGSRRQSMLAPPGPRPGESRRASNSSIRSTASGRSYSLRNSQHRPSDPDTHLTPRKLLEQPNSASVSPNIRQHRTPKKESRSSSTGAIALH